MSAFVIPDTHGCLKTLIFLLECKLQVSRSDTLYMLGDYIDRGSKSAELVEYLINLKESGYYVHYLKGNHEKMLLDSFQSNNYYKLWMYNSGDSTLESYSRMLKIDPNEMCLNDIPEKHILFFKSLPTHEILQDKYILVHGGLDFRQKDPFADEETLLWKRPEFLPDWFLPKKVVIHGHTPISIEHVLEGVDKPVNRLINLDAGCVYKGIWPGTGYLTALNLDSWEITYIKNLD